MQVFNYGGMAANAIDNFGQGLSQMRERQNQEQMMQQQQDALNQAAQLYSTGTPDEIAQFSIQNPQAGELLSKQLAFKSDATRQNMMDSMQQILLDPSQTESVLTNRIKMIQEQGGDPSQTMAELEQFRANPEGYEQKVERAYAMMDPKGYSAYRSSMPQQASKEFQYKDGVVFDPNTGEVKKTEFYKQGGSGQGGEQSTSNMKDFQFYQELKKSNPEMAEEFAVKAGIKKVAPKKGMSVTTERILNDAQNAAYDAFSSSDSITSLADSYAQNKGELGGGLFGSAQEAFKEFAGGEDEISSLKKQYARIKNSLVIKSLPQGPATDRDIAIFSKGFPGENADPEYIESFLRGMAKSQYITGRFNEFKAQHISDKGNTSGLMKAWKEESKRLDSELNQKFPKQSTPNVSSLSDEDLLNG